MYLKLNIKSLVFEGEIEVLRDALPLLNGVVGVLAGDQRQEHQPLELPVPLGPSQPERQPAACCGDPLPAKPERKKQRRKPGPKAKPRPEPRETAGAVRVDTGRSKERETLDALREHGPCGASRLAAMIGGGVSSGAVYQRLLGLMAKGLIRVGAERGAYEVIDD